MGLAHLREAGPERVLELLEEASGGIPVVINAASYADLEVFVLRAACGGGGGNKFPLPHRAVLPEGARGYHRAEGPRTRRICIARGLKRDTGSFGSAPTCPRPPASSKAALAPDGIRGVEMSVLRLLEPESREEELGRVAEEMNGSRASSEVVSTLAASSAPPVRRERRSFELRDRGGGLGRSGRGDEAGGPGAAALIRGGESRDHVQRHRHEGLEVRRAEVAGPSSLRGSAGPDPARGERLPGATGRDLPGATSVARVLWPRR